MSDIKIKIEKLVIHNLVVEGKTNIADVFPDQEEGETEDSGEEGKGESNQEKRDEPKKTKFVSMAIPDNATPEEIIERIEKRTGEKVPPHAREGIHQFVNSIKGKAGRSSTEEKGNEEDLLSLMEQNAIHTIFHLVDNALDFQAICSVLVCNHNPLQAWARRAVNSAKADPGDSSLFNTEIGLFCAAIILDGEDKNQVATVGPRTQRIIDQNAGIAERVHEILQKERERKEKPNRTGGVDTRAM